MSTESFNPTVFMSRAFEKAAAQSATDFSIAVIHALADKYGFDAKEALQVCQITEIKVKKSATRVKGEGKVRSNKTKAEPKPKRETPAFPLPFCGAAVEGWCNGLRLNHGLHSQCVMEAIQDGEYCKTCQGQADKNATGKPTYGCIGDRMACGLLEFCDPKAKKLTLPFANVMKKLNITREAAVAEAAKFGLTIPEEHFVERAAKRGRPKKDASASDTESEDGEKVKKTRGRPKKVKKVIAASVGDDLIASLVASAKSSSEVPTVQIVAPVSVAVTEQEDDLTSVSSSTSSATSSSSKKLVLKVKKSKAPKAPKVKSPEQIAKEAASAQRKAEKEAKTSALQTEYTTLADAAGIPSSCYELPTKIGELQKAIATFKRDAKEAAKALAEEEEALAKALAEEEAAIAAEALAAQQQATDAAMTITELQDDSTVETTVSELTAESLESSQPEEDEDSCNVVEFAHDGVTYWKDSDDNLYNPETSEQVGIWNATTSTVEAVEDFGSDEED